MLDDEKKDQEQTEDVSKAFGNEETKVESGQEEKADPKATEQKESEQEQEGSSSATEKEKQKEKTYTQAEVDAIMTKARKKYMKETDSKETDVVADDTGKETEVTEPSGETTQDLATGLTIDKYAQAELKASLAIAGINPSKVQRAVRLIDVSSVLENGQFSEEKANAEIEALLQEWPELKNQPSQHVNSFSFGAPEQEEQQQEDKQKGMLSSIFGNK